MILPFAILASSLLLLPVSAIEIPVSWHLRVAPPAKRAPFPVASTIPGSVEHPNMDLPWSFTDDPSKPHNMTSAGCGYYGGGHGGEHIIAYLTLVEGELTDGEQAYYKFGYIAQSKLPEGAKFSEWSLVPFGSNGYTTLKYGNAADDISILPWVACSSEVPDKDGVPQLQVYYAPGGRRSNKKLENCPDYIFEIAGGGC